MLVEGDGARTATEVAGEEGGKGYQEEEDVEIDLDKELSYIQKLREKINNNSSKVTNILAKK